MSKPTIVFHGNCPDGAGAALAAWCRFKDDATYMAAFHADRPSDTDPMMHLNGDVFVLDYSWPRQAIERIRARGLRCVVIDHHETAREALLGLDDCVFDMNQSGAVLAWRYFHPERPVPELLRYIQDRDLWKFEMPHSKEISAALKAQGCVNDWRKLIPVLEDWRDDGEDGIPRGSKRALIAEGAAIRRCEESMVEAMTRTARVIDWHGHKTALVNASVLFSEAAEQAYVRHGADIGAYWFFDYGKGKFQIGLRSLKGGVNVASLAKEYGGGGHAASAGMNLAGLPAGWMP